MSAGYNGGQGAAPRQRTNRRRGQGDAMASKQPGTHSRSPASGESATALSAVQSSGGLGATLWASSLVRMLVGVSATLLGLSCAFMVVAAAVELVQGGSKTEPGVLAGLIVMFGGLAVGCGSVVR